MEAGLGGRRKNTRSLLFHFWMSRKEMWLTLVTASLDLRLVEVKDLLVVDAPPEVWLNGLWQLTIAI